MLQETPPVHRNNFVDVKLDHSADINDVLVKILEAQYAEKEPNDLRAALELFGKTWDNSELLADFEVEFFDPPYVRVIQTATGVRGTVLFISNPRVYFYFCANTSTA